MIKEIKLERLKHKIVSEYVKSRSSTTNECGVSFMVIYHGGIIKTTTLSISIDCNKFCGYISSDIEELCTELIINYTRMTKVSHDKYIVKYVR